VSYKEVPGATHIVDGRCMQRMQGSCRALGLSRCLVEGGKGVERTSQPYSSGQVSARSMCGVKEAMLAEDGCLGCRDFTLAEGCGHRVRKEQKG
jgi:hypothetical protein